MVLQIELNTTNREYKKSAHMSLADHEISQLSLDISPISAAVGRELKPHSMQIMWETCVYVTLHR
jgi:hypothetical protein